MSAYLVSKKHIDALVSLALYGASDSDARQWYPVSFGARDVTTATATSVGGQLWQENLFSVLYRYPQDKASDYGDLKADYTFSRHPKVSTIQALKWIDCFEYQACEHPGWELSNSVRFCSSLRSRLICSLAEYDAADWAVA